MPNIGSVVNTQLTLITVGFVVHGSVIIAQIPLEYLLPTEMGLKMGCCVTVCVSASHIYREKYNLYVFALSSYELMYDRFTIKQQHLILLLIKQTR